MTTPKGTVYKGKDNNYEYQLFPEAYFTGADVKVYFGDTFVDDILGITFAIQEPIKPLYSYTSRTFKEAVRGARIVSGRFYIAFREAGWLSSVLDHLAQLGSIKDQENEIASVMQGGSKQQWHGRALATIEAIMSDYNGSINERYSAFEREIWGRNNSNDPGQESKSYFFRSRTKVDLQQVIYREGFDILLTYGPIEQALPKKQITTASGKKDTISVLPDSEALSFNNTVKAIRRVQITGSSQDIQPDGTIIEIYEFLAADIDS